MDKSVAVEVDALFDTEESWVNINKATNALLAYEQLHSDITEYWARLLREECNINSFANTKQLDYVNARAIKNLRTMHKQYDSETNHGLNTTMQKVWTDRIGQKLEEGPYAVKKKIVKFCLKIIAYN